MSTPHTRHEAYSEIFEGPVWTTFLGDFAACDQGIYDNFLSQTLRFDQLSTLTHDEKVVHLLAWAQLTGVPIVGLIRNERYFRDNLHLITNPEAQMPKPPHDPSHLFYTWDKHTYGAAGYNQNDVFLSFDGPAKQTVSVPATASLKGQVVLYHPQEDLSWYDDPLQDNPVKTKNIQEYKKRTLSDTISPKLCFEFISGYLADLRDFSDSYLDQVIMGVRALPKRIVNVMRGRAIYLSQEYGPSMTIHTSANIRKIDYLGLMPGVFLERLRGGDHILHTQLVHEIGHLVHQLVIMKRYYDSRLELETMCIIPEFPDFQGFLDELEKVFPERSDRYDEKENKQVFQQNLDRFGYITYYAQKDRAEDFAEVFKYFILHHKFLTMTASARTVLKKKVPDKNLLAKIEFMKKVVGMEGVIAHENLLSLKYFYSDF